MNTQVSITQNGKTTLATAGKYCDRNIDVNVDVLSNGAEQKTIINSIIDRTIAGEYVNNEVSIVGTMAFAYCTQLESVVFNKVEQVAGSAFASCTSLKKAEFFDLTHARGIYTAAFKDSGIEKLVIRGQTVCRLPNAGAFTNTPIVSGIGYIYVPDNLVDSYKTATNWSTYASQIKPISELEE